jgi:hypothetical protein
MFSPPFYNGFLALPGCDAVRKKTELKRKAGYAEPASSVFKIG